MPTNPDGTPQHLEAPDMPPAVIVGPRRTTPAPYINRDGLVSVQVNVNALGNNIIGDAANEPSIAVESHRSEPDRHRLAPV